MIEYVQRLNVVLKIPASWDCFVFNGEIYRRSGTRGGWVCVGYTS